MHDGPRVPMLDLSPALAELRSDVDAALRRVLDHTRFVLGDEVERFEQAFAREVGARHAIACASGSDALLLSLMALDVGPGDQVVCPSFSFFATAAAIARLGATPVFADVDARTACLDPQSAADAARACSSLRAIVAVHLFGDCAPSEALADVAARAGAALVHDAAQAAGARDASGRSVGARGELAAWSFYPSKNLGALGDGGAITTDDDVRAARLRALRVHGARARYRHDELGINSRLDALQAAVLSVKLPHLERWITERTAIADDYDARLGGCAALRLPARPAPPARHARHQYVVRVPATLRDALRDALDARGIETAAYYAAPLHAQRALRGRALAPVALDATERLAAEVVALPIYPGLAPAARARVVDALLDALASLGAGDAIGAADTDGSGDAREGDARGRAGSARA